MITKKEFYFVRHGQTNHNISNVNLKSDHPADTPLNETGKNQARIIEPIVATLPVHVVCASPLRRVQETKEIITPRLQVNHHNIDDLSECSMQIWRDMLNLKQGNSLPSEGHIHEFIHRVRNGVNQSLSLPGTPLIVAHGGIHWALCYMLNIIDHEWAIDNCVPVHFSLNQHGKWIAKKIK